MSGERCWGGEDLKMHNVQPKVKEQIMCIVKDLELVLGELKTVSTEMKEVVGQIDQLTSNLNLCEDINESYKSDTLDSSSSGVTVSTLEKSKDKAKLVIKPIPTSSAVLTVLRKSKPPPPPPRRTPVRAASPAKSTCTNNNHKTNGTNMHNGTHSTTDGLERNCEGCSARSDTSTRVPQSQLEADDKTKSLSNTFISQQSSKCVRYPSSTTKLEVPIQRKACTCGCSARSQHNTCLHQRAPSICNSSTSTTNVATASHSKHQSAVRKPTSTTV
ncbi:protein Largen-like [Leucoraja erinacea]|uniref:protein Largen-like n=1 Tax=Leucoraja erinaceus TaxID=7782 RepID=UPI002453A615|nr:protein Largen-like [Leucoraja erinacea]